MRRGFPKKVEWSGDGSDAAWVSVGSINHGMHGTSAVLCVEAPFRDASGTMTVLRCELNHDEAEQLAAWLVASAAPKRSAW